MTELTCLPHLERKYTQFAGKVHFTEESGVGIYNSRHILFEEIFTDSQPLQPAWGATDATISSLARCINYEHQRKEVQLWLTTTLE